MAEYIKDTTGDKVRIDVTIRTEGSLLTLTNEGGGIVGDVCSEIIEFNEDSALELLKCIIATYPALKLAV